MTKTLLIGPACSGKTHRVLEEFVAALRENPDPLARDMYFLVPSAEHTERVTAVTVQRGVPGFFNHRVTTLSRLFEDVFGLGNENFISDGGRYFVLREILEKGPWSYFDEIRQSPGLIHLLLSFIGELKESLISPPTFRAKMNELKRLEPEGCGKYEALADIYEAYAVALQNKGMKDRQDAVWECLSQKGRSTPGGNRFRKIWLDGFFDFSPLQLACLGRLCELTDDMVMTLTTESVSSPRNFFEPVDETRQALMEMGFRCEQMKRASRLLVPGALAAIEKNVFLSAAVKTVKPDESVSFFEAVGLEGEMEMAVREILRFYRSGQYRFSDYAILLRQVGEYDSVIRSVFAKYGVPVEVHERERLSYAPLMQVIVRLLKIFQDGWKRTDLMGFLKSNYVRRLGSEPKDYEWVARLEHTAMAGSITGGREAWLKPWTESGYADAAFDDLKEKRLRPLAVLEDALRGAGRFSEIRQGMIRALEMTFGILEKADGFEDYVRRDAASYRRFESLLREIEIAMPVSTSEEGSEAGGLFDSFVTRFLRLVDLDLFPLHEKNRNKVQVYDVSMARQKEYKVVFVSGLLEKKFPVQLKEDPVLSDWERTLFNRAAGDGTLKERLPRQKIERYLFYLAVTRAREKLILTYPRFDLEGKEALRSCYVDEIEALFDGKISYKKQELGRPYPFPEEAVNRRDLELAVMGELWDSAPGDPSRQDSLVGLTNRLMEDPGSTERFRRAFFDVDDELTDQVIAQTGIFRPTVTSATSLETYAKCPFKYYAQNVLRLEDLEEEVNVTARGNILHKVLELCFTEWAGKPAIYRDRDRARERALQILSEVIREIPLLTEKKYQYDLEYEDLRDMLLLFLDEELERLATAPLKPLHFEYAFGLQDNPKAPALEIRDGPKVIRVRGKIDRIDSDAGGKVAAVLDYKRAVKFQSKNLALGISLQLPIYAAYLEKYLGLQCAGAELYSIKDREKKGFYREEHAGLFGKKPGKGMVLAKQKFDEVIERAMTTIRTISRDMEQMKIRVFPRDAFDCTNYCPYAAVCRIEKWRLPLIEKEAMMTAGMAMDVKNKEDLAEP
jgi:ATP-dependent helicase/nuclease subunit B